MPTDIDSIFKATSKSTWSFLVENGQGCYIPAYQRLYAWDKDTIGRLFEDVIHGLHQATNRPDTITYIGTIIAIHDTDYRTVDPIYHDDVAPRVMTIIDGQQRISTIVMANIALHEYVRYEVKKFRRKTDECSRWINAQCDQLLADLRNTILIDRSSGDGNYRYYPRIVRAYLDAWSRRRGQAKYDSPVARVIWEYIDFAESGKSGHFKYKPTDSSGKVIENHKMVYEAFRFIQSTLASISKSSSRRQEFSLPDLKKATESSEFCKSIWGYDLKDEIKQYIYTEDSDPIRRSFCHLIRSIIFARYLNNHIAITLVTANNEDDAFDMFEALNSTGEPLTALETFKPKVVELESLEKFKASPSYRYIQEIESYLERYTKADSKQRATSDMLIPFALAETGDKLSKKLGHQRRYLREEFNALTKGDDIENRRNIDIDEGRIFVQCIARMAEFMRHGWNIDKEESMFTMLEVKDEDAIVGFEALKGLNHSITIAPLFRFFQFTMDARDRDEKRSRAKVLVAAIKATVAFSVLWRGAKGGTAGIDSHYRDIMAGVEIEGDGSFRLSRRPRHSDELSLARYKTALQSILENKGNIKGQSQWVRLASEVGVYHDSKVLARFLLFCASDDAVPDTNRKGLVAKGRLGVAPMLKIDRWNDTAYFTVEHIAPQANGSDWKDEIYGDPKTIHTLGNLILLPNEENSAIGNRSWKHKRIMYKLLASETQNEFESIRSKLDDSDLTLSQNATQILAKSQYLGMCRSVASYSDDWSAAIIKERSVCFAELAWKRLKPWLYPENEE